MASSLKGIAHASEPWIRFDNDTLQLPAAPKGGQSSAELSVLLDPSVVGQHGLHSGVIRFDDPTTVNPADHETLVTVMSGRPLAEHDDYTLHVSGAGDQGIEAATYRSVFVSIRAPETKPPSRSRSRGDSTRRSWRSPCSPTRPTDGPQPITCVQFSPTTPTT